MADEHSILVVDDEEMICWGIKQTLVREGETHVETALSGEQALEIMKQETFDLVITDIRMKGGMNGFELLSNIRTLYPSTGVVVMTAYGSAAAKREATERGSLFYLDKTFEIDEIRHVVSRALEQVDSARAMQERQAEGFSGQIGNLNLVDMVQLHCLARNTVVLHVQTRHQSGAIGFEQGEVVFARTDTDLEGREAFLDMLGWTGGQFETREEQPDGQNIYESWESLLIEASDIIAAAAQSAAETASAAQTSVRKSDGETDMHTVLEELAVEQGVLGVFIAGDTGVLIDRVITSYPGEPADIGEMAKGLTAISRIHRVVEPDSVQNRVIFQFERTRVLAMEISDTAVYLIIVTTGAGVLARLLQQLNKAVEQLASLF